MPDRLKIALTSVFCEFNKFTAWFICSNINSNSNTNTGHNNGQHVKFKFEDKSHSEWNEMCSRKKMFPFLSVWNARVCAHTIDKYTHTHTFIHSRADTPSVVCFVCTSWAWWDSWLSLFLILIWFEHVIVDAAAVAADVADPAHLCRTFICANVTDLFWAPEPDHPASHHQRKIMPTYSLVCLQDV